MRNAICAAGAHLLFLPKCLPDLNPIELVFANLKSLIRKIGARTYEARCEAAAETVAHSTLPVFAAYLKNTGYA